MSRFRELQQSDIPPSFIDEDELAAALSGISLDSIGAQPVDGDLSAIAALDTQPFGRGFLTQQSGPSSLLYQYGYDIQSTATPPTVRANGTPLQAGDRWIQTTGDRDEWLWDSGLSRYVSEQTYEFKANLQPIPTIGGYFDAIPLYSRERIRVIRWAFGFVEDAPVSGSHYLIQLNANVNNVVTAIASTTTQTDKTNFGGAEIGYTYNLAGTFPDPYLSIVASIVGPANITMTARTAVIYYKRIAGAA